MPALKFVSVVFVLGVVQMESATASKKYLCDCVINVAMTFLICHKLYLSTIVAVFVFGCSCGRQWAIASSACWQLRARDYLLYGRALPLCGPIQ